MNGFGNPIQKAKDRLVAKLGAVPWSEFERVKAESKAWEDKYDSANSDLGIELQVAEHTAEQHAEQIWGLQNTINRYETWAKENNIELPPDFEGIWSTLIGYRKHGYSGKFRLTEKQENHGAELMAKLARWTGCSEGVLSHALREQVAEYMMDCGEGPASDFYVPDFEYLKEHGHDAVDEVIQGASPVPARNMGL